MIYFDWFDKLFFIISQLDYNFNFDWFDISFLVRKYWLLTTTPWWKHTKTSPATSWRGTSRTINATTTTIKPICCTTATTAITTTIKR